MSDWIHEREINRVYCCGQWWNVTDYAEYVSYDGTAYAKFMAAPMTPPWDAPLENIVLDMNVPFNHIICAAKEN